MRKAEYKPLLFTTTVRNPERIKPLLHILYKFNGKNLTDELAIEIIGELIRYGLYRPMKKNKNISEKWKTADNGKFAEFILTDNELKFMLENNPQEHKEAGFAKGYPSRFATFFDFAKELGFVYFKPGEKIEFSEIGTKMASIFSIEISDYGEILVKEENNEYEQQAFLQAMAKYQRNNPFVRVLNDNVPLILLLETIQKLNADKNFNNAGISKRELPLLIFWKDNNSDELYKRIKELRNKFRYEPSDEIIIDICTKEILPNFKKFKPKSIISEYPDEFIRKMRLTDLISLRGAGRFIDINHNEDDKIKYILANYSKYKKYKTEKEYFNYMAEIDEKLFSITPIKIDERKSEALLTKWVEFYDWKQIKYELENLAKKSRTKDDILKYLPDPARLEFLMALAIKSKFPQSRVIPNYPCDDEGLPTSTAGGIGDKGDIEYFENKNGILIEVTMSEGRVQTAMEIWPIGRHFEAFKNKYKLNSQCIFIAPSIFADSQNQIEWLAERKEVFIRAYKIVDFICYLETDLTQSLCKNQPTS